MRAQAALKATVVLRSCPGVGQGVHGASDLVLMEDEDVIVLRFWKLAKADRSGAHGTEFATHRHGDHFVCASVEKMEACARPGGDSLQRSPVVSAWS